MYVCICRGVTERHIHQAIERGVRTMRDLRRELGVAGCCGKCGVHACQMLRDHASRATEGSSESQAVAA